MGTGALLAVGLLAAGKRIEDGGWRMENSNKAETITKAESGESGNPPSPGFGATGRETKTVFSFNAAVKSAIVHPQSAILVIAAGMLGVGLVMSYSRGAWLGAGMGLLYLASCYGKLKWKYVAVGVGLLALGSMCFWSSTADSAPWYVKRADLGRPSAQNRAVAWRAGLEIMRDHPLGVGWNNAVNLYGEKYHPPEGGPAAITTNDYMMLGTELGIPALVCFVAYVGLCYRNGPRIQKLEVRSQKLESGSSLLASHSSLRAACLSGALVLLVAFWFDGGLFKLPTAALFWVLLELGKAGKVESSGLRVESPKAV